MKCGMFQLCCLFLSYQFTAVICDGSSYCGVGTRWEAETSTCVVGEPSLQLSVNDKLLPDDYTWSSTDKLRIKALRNNIERFVRRAVPEYCPAKSRILEVGPLEETVTWLPADRHYILETLDIDEDLKHSSLQKKPDHIGDISRRLPIPSDSFDCIMLCEVLEHCRKPWKAVRELRRILKPGGNLILTTPFDLRHHHPYPDMWRFTEDGLKELLAPGMSPGFIDSKWVGYEDERLEDESNRFDIIEMKELGNKERPGFPIQFTAVARKPLLKTQEL